VTDPFATLAGRRYRVGLVDPPWAFRTHSGKNRTPTQKKFNEAEDHYPTMKLADMQALPVGDLFARDAVLAMWIVGSHCDVALDLARSWGFSFTTDLFYWCKQRLVGADQIDLFTGDIADLPMSMGYYTRKQLEPCWLFKRGRGVPVCAHDVRQLIIAPRGIHSRKPEEQYPRIERLFGDQPRLELFARNTRPGWDSWGNETDKFDQPAPGIAA
jgi:N6-adenosine-specific RNA methylase IME4